MRVGAGLLAAAMAMVGSVSADPMEVTLERTVSDADRGVRAIIRYRPQVPTGGQDEIVNADGSVSIIHWDGLAGQFEAEVIEGAIEGPDAEAFLREAALAVCPSADAAQLAESWVQQQGPFLRIMAQCPATDAAND